MERNSTNENFEHFLRQNAEDYRMHPSDKVWDSISKNLHKPKRRYFGLILLLVSTSLIGYSVYEFGFAHSNKEKHTVPMPSVKTSASSSINSSTTDNVKNKQNEVAVNFPIAKATEQLANKVEKSDKTSEQQNKPLVGTSNVDNAQTNLPSGEGTREPWTASLLEGTKASVSSQTSLLQQKPDMNIANPQNQDLAKQATKAGSKARKKGSRLEMMFFFTPTISYRKLSENKSYLRSTTVGAPYSFAALYDVNNVVTHKPNIGLEFGATTKYAVTKNLKLRAGVQFNINRYDIKAFKYVPEVATIALNNGYGLDSVNTMSSYRNLNAASTDWLQNFYFQVSTPVGLEVSLPGKGKTRFGVASTIQPTYVLGDRAYLITADYKNYAQVPWLIRRWNVNTNLETFVAYSSGKINWQIGPQVRYQLLSSFVSKYPVKENLFDFGLKVGISFNQNQ